MKMFDFSKTFGKVFPNIVWDIDLMDQIKGMISWIFIPVQNHDKKGLINGSVSTGIVDNNP